MSSEQIHDKLTGSSRPPACKSLGSAFISHIVGISMDSSVKAGMSQVGTEVQRSSRPSVELPHRIRVALAVKSAARPTERRVKMMWQYQARADFPGCADPSKNGPTGYQCWLWAVNGFINDDSAQKFFNSLEWPLSEERFVWPDGYDAEGNCGTTVVCPSKTEVRRQDRAASRTRPTITTKSRVMADQLECTNLFDRMTNQAAIAELMVR